MTEPCSHQVLRELLDDRLQTEVIEVVRCPECGESYSLGRDDFNGEVYLVNTDVENPQVEGPQ